MNDQERPMRALQMLCIYFFKILLHYIVLSTSAIWKRTERIIFFRRSKMDVLKTIITVSLILFPRIIKSEQNIQGND